MASSIGRKKQIEKKKIVRGNKERKRKSEKKGVGWKGRTKEKKKSKT